ncbi:MAG: phosphate/phosphite/phosphonate ABC transporter substrate-binding protein [Planctomycetota bacterium]|nr:MAG: phosphate/phosphite/phosphonate ABC transporter substrate-binding protein [Planctomycetota bacterium]
MRFIFLITTAIALMASFAMSALADERGSAQNPLRVMLIPADGGTEDGTRADYEPLFNAITQHHGIHFNIRVGQSYAAVIEAMARSQMDIAWFGPLSYLQARERDGAELLAVEVSGGSATYKAALFVRADSGITSIEQLKGKRLALGDVNSTSSFAFPVAMLVGAGIDPVNDFSRVILAGTHANSLAALGEGRVDVAGAALISYERAVNQGAIDPEKVIPLAVSVDIPNPPMAMHPSLPQDLKDRLRIAFGSLHETEGVAPEMIRGYGGRVVQKYDATVSEDLFTATGESMQLVDDELKAALVRKASEAR